jgi:quercetin dioxygenase-like cupin family protein
LKRGSFLPSHDHIHEQTGYLVSGKIVLTLGEEMLEMEPGGFWTIPGGVAHDVGILEGSIIVELFSARRDEHII